MAETRTITCYEVQLHYTGGVGIAGWARGGWGGRYLDRRKAEAQAEGSRDWLVAGAQDDVRVAELQLDVVGPLAPVTVTAPDVYVFTHAVEGTVRGMAEIGFTCVDHHGDETSGPITLTFAKVKED